MNTGLLGGVLRSLAAARRLPDQDFEPEVRALGTLPELSLVGEKDAPLLDLWSALGVSPRASIDSDRLCPRRCSGGHRHRRTTVLH
jgi:hypothetical protein